MVGSRGGGGSYFTANDVAQLRREALERLERSRSDAEVNAFLQRELVSINDRDYDSINRRLDQIEDRLGGQIEEVDRLIFGGSVAKHTYVDGLSDVDSLMVLKGSQVAGKGPEEVREEFGRVLLSHLPRGDVESTDVGKMAVTIRYRDGTEIQILPALESSGELSISSADGSSWVRIRPEILARGLTKSNSNQGGAAIPAIKLAKAILANKLGAEAPSGYHVEALAVAAFRDYSGARTPKAMLTRLFERASEDACRPIRDITGQSQFVDEALGPPNSPSRQQLCRVFRDLGRTVASSQSTSEWRSLFE